MSRRPGLVETDLEMANVHGLSIGSLAGLAATVPMTAVMLAMNRFPPRERLPLPPRRIAEQMTRKIKPLDDLEGASRETFMWSAHAVYGAAAGALYGALAPRRSGLDALLGAVFGLAVWAISYPMWLPAAGVDEHPERHTGRRVSEQIVSHLVWGAATGELTRRLRERSRTPSARRA